MLRKQKLDPVPCLLINDRIMQAFVNLVLVCKASKVDGVDRIL